MAESCAADHAIFRLNGTLDKVRDAGGLAPGKGDHGGLHKADRKEMEWVSLRIVYAAGERLR